jgi:hypothetical protein
MSTFTLIALVLLGLFAAGGLVATVVVVLGFYMGWFRMSASSAGGKSQVRFTMEENKILNDKNTVVEAVRDLGHRGKDKAATPVETMTDASAPAG